MGVCEIVKDEVGPERSAGFFGPDDVSRWGVMIAGLIGAGFIAFPKSPSLVDE